MNPKPPPIDAPRDPVEEVVSARARAFFIQAAQSHGWDHSLRVVRLATVIGGKEGADLAVVRAAAYLHDIARPLQDQSNGGVCHAEKGAELAQSVIAPLPFSDDQKTNILHAIRAHRFRGDNRPETLEAQVLFDADKLDSIGAIGIARTFQFAGEVGARLHAPEIPIENTKPYTENDTGFREYSVKLKKIRDQMLTTEGKRLARKRHAFMQAFFARFLAEYDALR